MKVTITPRKIWRIAKGIIPGIISAMFFVGSVVVVFILFFGFHRVREDFIPLDNSRIGPNLCASITVLVLITAYHEYKILGQDGMMDKPVDDVIDDMVHAVLHPAETAEQNVADDIARILMEEDDNGVPGVQAP